MTMEDGYIVKTQVFEGPLETLLLLIEKRKLFINDISLAAVTDDYIAHVKSLGTMSLEHTSEFIVIASTLLLIKSKSLLPELTLSYEEERNIDTLERRLLTYQKYKAIAAEVSRLFGRRVMYLKSTGREEQVVFTPDVQLTPISLARSIAEVIQAIPKIDKKPEVHLHTVVRLEDMISHLAERVQKAVQVSFKEFSGVGKKEKVHIIVSFLAMLELVKNGIIQVRQDRYADDITIEPVEQFTV